MKIKTETQTGSIVSFKYDDEIAEITGLTTSFEPSQDGTPWMSDVNQTPYLLRQSPQYGHDYDREIDTLIGGTIAWNQLVKNGNFADTSEWRANGNGSLSVSGNVGTVTLAAQGASGIFQALATVLSHKYLLCAEIKSSINIQFGVNQLGGRKAITANNSYQKYAYILNCTATASDAALVVYTNQSSLTGNADVKNVQLIDLTATFGTEIADYVYGLEQSTAGSGIAWLKSYGFLTKDYYAYDSGSLVSVKTSEHRTTGKNLCPKKASGTLAGATFTVNADGTIKVTGTPTNNDVFFYSDSGVSVTLPKGNYKLTGGGAGGYAIRLGIGENWATFLAQVQNGETAFTLDEETEVAIAIRLQGRNGQSCDFTYTPMIRRADVSDSTYEPYESHSYPLGNDDLRGIFKLSNGNLYADGDVKTSDGQIQRRYSILDLGTIDWEKWATNVSGIYRFVNQTMTNLVKKPASTADYPNIICSNYTKITADNVWNTTAVGVTIHPQGYIIVFDNNLSTLTPEAFKTAMSGVYLVYELATPTTEQADPFASPQIVSPLGTEEYVDERSVPVPVGHRTVYMLPYPISGWDEAKAYVSPTEEEEDATIYTINLNGTRYGGTIDFFRGVMNVTMAEVDLVGTETWSVTNSLTKCVQLATTLSPAPKAVDASVKANAISDTFAVYSGNYVYSNDTEGISFDSSNRLRITIDKTKLTLLNQNGLNQWLQSNNVQVVYELATPLEVQLTAEQIEALQGQNNVWANCGDITLTWRHIPVLDEAVMLNGKYLELTIDGYSTLGTSGRRSLGRQLDTYSVGTADGETVKNSTFPSRKITVNYVIQTDTEEELTEAINQLANILNQDECDFVFRDEPDKFFSGYGLLDSEPKKYRHAVKGTWSLYCAYPFKRSNKLVELSSKDPTVASVDAHSATFVFDYNGTLPAHPILRAEFASAKSGGEYNEDGDCGYVAFLDAEENIIQLGNPEVLDVDQYANSKLINREFTSLSGWTASGVTVGDLTDQFWENGKGQTQSYAKGTGTLTKSVGNGAINMEFDIVHRLCVSAANQTGAFECYAKNGNTIVVGFKIEKTGSGTTGVVSYIINNKVVGTDSIDLSYYNTHFGYCNRTAVYGTEYYSVYEKYYVKKKGKKKKKYHWVTYPRTVQTGWSYTQSNLNSGWTKDGSVIVFSIGNLADRTFKNSDVELTPSTSIVFNISGSFHTNAVHSCAMLSKAGVPFAEIPNVFTAGDVVEGDCNSADVMLYRAGSLEGHLEPQYGALGNDWEDFEIKPGKNIIRAVWSDWVNTSYKPEIKIIFNEVYV